MERAEFDRLILDQLPAAHRFAIRLTGDVDLAEDVVQDALVRASAGWRTFRGGSSPQTWLFRVVVNAFRDQLRRSGRAESEDLPGDVGDVRTPGPPSLSSTRELGEIVARAVATLPPRQREVLVLTAYEGRSAPEVAALLGVSEQNVRTTLHLAREKLRARLAPYLSEAERGAPRA